ncbi:MAG: peptidyl-prolyl cis-trans isomerase [Sulfurospirillaceae bacterium]|nr:peptidyl-prolyl cis-trans isomerase [Sulfurospirillaceae bacterium]MDD3463183.1 peptidyl-prolyl cis-trans isomerase [Sulfurospirillaceae bacterium]
MIKMTRMFLSTLMLVAISLSTSQAGIVNGVSVIINKEPITLFEVYKYSQKLNISKKEALDILVRQKLEDAEIKKENITVDSFEVDKYIENIATSNKMSKEDFLNMLKSKNIDVIEYKKDMTTKLKREKLYQKAFAGKMQAIDEQDIAHFYNENKEMFTQASSFTITTYTSPDESALEKIQQNPMAVVAGVEIRNATVTPDKIDQSLQDLLNKTSSGSFTPIVKASNNFMMFYVKEKGGVQTASLDQAKNFIYNKLAREKEQKSIEEYFEKLKSSASITVVRAP